MDTYDVTCSANESTASCFVVILLLPNIKKQVLKSCSETFFSGLKLKSSKNIVVKRSTHIKNAWVWRSLDTQCFGWVMCTDVIAGQCASGCKPFRMISFDEVSYTVILYFIYNITSSFVSVDLLTFRTELAQADPNILRGPSLISPSCTLAEQGKWTQAPMTWVTVVQLFPFPASQVKATEQFSSNSALANLTIAKGRKRWSTRFFSSLYSLKWIVVPGEFPNHRYVHDTCLCLDIYI